MNTEFAKTYQVGTDENDVELFRNHYNGYEIKYRDGNNKEQTLYSESFPLSTHHDTRTVNTVLGEVITIFVHNMISIKKGLIFKRKLDTTISENNSRSEHNQIKKQVITQFFFVNECDNVCFDGPTPLIIELSASLNYRETIKL